MSLSVLCIRQKFKVEESKVELMQKKTLGRSTFNFPSSCRFVGPLSRQWELTTTFTLEKSRVFNIIFGLTIPLSLRKNLLVFFLQFSLRLRWRTRNTEVVPFICHTNSNQGLLQIWKDHCTLQPCFHYDAHDAGSKLTLRHSAILRDSQYLMRT